MADETRVGALPDQQAAGSARSADRLHRLILATRAIATDLDLSQVLHRAVEEARALVGARYVALVVRGQTGDPEQVVESAAADAARPSLGLQDAASGRPLLTALLAERRPLRVADAAAYARVIGAPDGSLPGCALLGVPVLIRERPYGYLCLLDKDGGFDAEDEEVVTSLATTVAFAFDNARLFDAVWRRERWLELSHELTGELLRTPGRDEALRLLTRALRRAADADLAAVTLLQDDGSLLVSAGDGPGAGSVVGVTAPPGSPGVRAVLEGQPILVEDLQAQTAFTGPIVRLGMGPLAAVPLAAHDQVLGSLLIANLPGRRVFTARDLQLANDFATQAALVLLTSAAQNARERLAMVEERARIARDLHDHAIQGIFSVGLALNGLAGRVGGETGARLGGLVDQLDDAIRAVRQSIFALQRGTGDDCTDGLRARAADLVDRAAEGLGFRPTLSTEGPVDSAADRSVVDDLLAVLREALSNATRHAQATRVDVRVVASDGLTLEVADDGRGIGGTGRRSGLGNMLARAERHAGTCDVVVTPGGGTTVRWHVPRQAPSTHQP